jgi:hypothetical protein
VDLRTTPIARLFTKDKIVESRVLNALGAQPFRVCAARAAHLMRNARRDGIVAAALADVERDGIAVIPDFLPAERFRALRDECMGAIAEGGATVARHGPNTLETFDAISRGPSRLPEVFAYLRDPRLKALFEGAERRTADMTKGTRQIEKLTQGPLGALDPETELHLDTFFNTHKAWLYLNDVERANAPFVFVKGSHRINLARLRYDYRGSLEETRSYVGSRRVTAEEIAERGLEETVFTCAANTMVIANTFGYHRRLRGEPGRTREAVQVSMRWNPFRP